jgi:DNA gyrase subunit A
MAETEVGLVRKIDIEHEMQQAYLDYAMSVIVARALPDARDGLKPVHRRILYAMHDMNIHAGTPYKKSARIVGEVLGKYHPHGDMAVYDAMARMAQDFSMRYLLVDGQGNFGSIDGDSPAAMRYTEARLAGLAATMLRDIEKDTVEFSDNFDGTLKEPDVLPAALPNLLVNGATGIAVGMATSIPPHNLGEVVDALVYMLENWEKLEDISIQDLMRFIQGPDFPTGGVIIPDADGEGLAGAYGAGRGRVTVQARAHLEQMERGRSRIIVTELPYMTNKASLVERIAALSREGKLEGLADLRDESDRQGMRIVIELTKNVEPEAVLRELYKNTPMQNTFSIIMLALVGGEPRLLSLKQALRVYLEHRLEIIRRRSTFELERARRRAHILEGLLVALKNLDEVITLIRRSPDVETARERLIKRFKLSDEQAQAILDMPLRRLASLERKKIEDEYKDLKVLIKGLEELLRSPAKMRKAIGDELRELRQAQADRRRTHIVSLEKGGSRAALLTAADVTPSHPVWIAASREGLICRLPAEHPARLSGSDAPRWMMEVNSRDTLYLVAENGQAASAPVHALPEAEKPADGIPLMKASALSAGDKLAAWFALPPKDELPEDWYIVTLTSQGMVKKTALGEAPGPSARPFSLARVNNGDRLIWAGLSSGSDEILMLTAQGMMIRFPEAEVRPMGMAAGGVMGIKLAAGDEVVGAALLPAEGDAFLLAGSGKAKRIKIEQVPAQGRYGQGVIAWKLAAGDRLVGLAVGEGAEKATLHLSKSAARVIRLDAAPLQTRAAAGQMITEVRSGERVVGLTLPWVQPRPGEARLPAKKSRRAKTESQPTTQPAAPKSSRKPAKKATQLALLEETAAPAKPAALSKTGTKSSPQEKPAAPAKTAPKPAEKPAARSKTGAKSSPQEKPAAKAKTAPKPAEKPAARSKTGAKSSPEEKPAAKAKTAPKPAEKPAARSKTGAKSSPEEKPAAPAKPAARPKAGAKPVSKPAKKPPAGAKTGR